MDEDRKTVVLYSFPCTGKTTVGNSVAGIFKEREMDVCWIYDLDRLAHSPPKDCSSNTCVIVDEVSLFYITEPKLRLYALLNDLQLKGARILLLSFKDRVNPDAVSKLGDTELIKLPLFVSESEAAEILTLPFEDTGVALPDHLKQEIIALSGRTPVVMQEIVRVYLEKGKERILNIEDDVKLEGSVKNALLTLFNPALINGSLPPFSDFVHLSALFNFDEQSLLRNIFEGNLKSSLSDFQINVLHNLVDFGIIFSEGRGCYTYYIPGVTAELLRRKLLLSFVSLHRLAVPTHRV